MEIKILLPKLSSQIIISLKLQELVNFTIDTLLKNLQDEYGLSTAKVRGIIFNNISPMNYQFGIRMEGQLNSNHDMLQLCSNGSGNNNLIFYCNPNLI